jgi:hypothetical protein
MHAARVHQGCSCASCALPAELLWHQQMLLQIEIQHIRREVCCVLLEDMLISSAAEKQNESWPWQQQQQQ